MNEEQIEYETLYGIDRIYTTGEVARLCKGYLGRSGIVSAFEKGLLKGFKIPGSRHRRVFHDSVVDFLKECMVPASRLRKFLGLNEN